MSRQYDAKQAALKAHPNHRNYAISLFLEFLDISHEDFFYSEGMTAEEYIFGNQAEDIADPQLAASVNAQAEPTSRKVFVVMGNDYPDAVFSEEAVAEAFCKMRRAVPGSRINWRVYDFELDGKLTRNKQAVLAIIAKKKKKREVKEVVYRSISIFSRELEFFFQHEGELFYFDTVEECKAKIDELDAKAEAAQ